ncbi:MAG: hypothetical protein HKL98_11790 [Burkholderiales bacterium]|nr:hypothetical protein [Burkholderiales bacterium]
MFDFVFEKASGCSGRTALVMLPGAGMRSSEFLEHGFVDAMRRRNLQVDAVMVGASSADYVSVDFGQRLKRQLLHFLNGYSLIWLAGISLGAFGVLRLLQEGMEKVGGMLLLSPFISTRGTVARVVREGGLDCWSPHAGEHLNDDTALLCWLKHHPQAFSRELYLGWGTDDRYSLAGELLAARLPENRVFRIPGDHDWPTWNSLWQEMLDAAPFPAGEKIL